MKRLFILIFITSLMMFVLSAQETLIPSTSEGISMFYNDVDLETFASQNASTFPPKNVEAFGLGTEARISWEQSGNVWFSQSTERPYPNSLGGVPVLLGVHRFTPAQLENLGVAGAMLSTVSFMPVQTGFTSIELRVWTGGSGDPLTPGTLVHTQEVPLPTSVFNWIDVDLTTPIQIPTNEELWYGFNWVISTGHPLGVDPMMNHMFGNITFWEGRWNTLNNFGVNTHYNWRLRAMATSATGTVRFAMSDNDFTLLTGYNVYRSTLANIENPSAWTTIASNLQSLVYVDPTWGGVPNDNYQYIIRSVYTGGILSEPAFSNTVVKAPNVTVTGRVIT